MKIALTLVNMLALTDTDLTELSKEDLRNLRAKLTDKICDLTLEVKKPFNPAETKATYSLLDKQRATLISIRKSVINHLS